MKQSVLFLLILLISGCSGHILTKRDALSRDYTYISFLKTREPFIKKAEVGGEQLSITKLLAFEGDRFRISAKAKNGTIKMYVDGEGIVVEEEQDGGNQKIIRIEDVPDCLVQIEISAYPEPANYILMITPL